MPDSQPRIGILVVAYNAASTLASVLDRIPVAFRPRVSEILVCDDHSEDATYLVGLGYKQLATDLPLTVVRHPRNLGYGGNQKAGYHLALERGLDIIVLLHGDGQYAPECLPDIVAPLERGEADAVFGSRMMIPGAARKGGMPLYKYVGNKILTAIENRALGTELSEFHSGYRAYNVHTLAQLPFEQNSDGFDFDTEIIVQLHEARKRIVEIPIPTYYGDEICYVNGLKYAKDVTGDVLRYRLRKLGLGKGAGQSQQAGYALKESDDSSHGRLLARLITLPPSRILDLGCSGGLLAERLRATGHEVVGVDVVEVPGVRHRVDRFVQANLDFGIPDEVGDGFDVIVAADVLEHVRRPAEILRQMSTLLKPRGFVLACIPNFGHWYPRLRTALGFFDYDQRGILDSDHVRFFTRRSFLRLVEDVGMRMTHSDYVGLPFDVLGTDASGAEMIRRADRPVAGLWPTLGSYQMIFRLERKRDEETVSTVVHGPRRLIGAAAETG